MEKDNEFYIGWLPETPPATARMVRKAVATFFLIGLAVALLIVVAQSGFSSGTFELGKQTTLEGWIRADPFPMLDVRIGHLPGGKILHQQLLLLSPGKFGAGRKLREIESRIGVSLLNRCARVTGALIYHDGKTAFEIFDASILEDASPMPPLPTTTIADSVCLRGEITDPKCLLGVMKPGEGKPHLDCAVRCIAGGIPPVLKVANANNEAEYYLLTGGDGQPINDEILPFVGHGVAITGRLEQRGDWLFMHLNPAEIRRFDKFLLNAPMCQSN